MKLNTKGFTLVELLAVIVVLAVIMLMASSNIGGVLTKVRKNALASEGNAAVNGAKEAYQMAILEGKVTTGQACFSIEYLYNNGYFEKGKTTGEGADGYTGSVLVSPDENGVKYTYKFWISNGSYVISNASFGANGNGAANGTSADTKCGFTSPYPTYVTFFPSNT